MEDSNSSSRYLDYRRLFAHDDFDFDRGSKWVQFKRWFSRKRRAVFKKSTDVARGCGFDTRLGFWDKPNQVLFWSLLGLVVFTSMEPILLKITADHAMVDEIRDYRYLLAQLVCGAHIPFVVTSAVRYSYKYPERVIETQAFPYSWYLLLASLNTLHLIALIVTSGSVPGPVIIILIQATLPFTAIISAVVDAILGPPSDAITHTLSVQQSSSSSSYFEIYSYNSSQTTQTPIGNQMYTPNRNAASNSNANSNLRNRTAFNSNGYRNRNSGLAYLYEKWCKDWRGSTFICVAIVIGTLPIFLKERDALGNKSECIENYSDCLSSTILFALAALPASLSAVFEERILVQYSLPISPAILHGYLVPLQFILGVLFAPIGLHLQHPDLHWDNLTGEIDSVLENVKDGVKCLILGDEVGFGLIGHSDPNWCKPLLPLLIGFVFVSMVFHYLTLQVLKKGGEKALRIGATLAIPIAWGGLAIYDISGKPHVDKIVSYTPRISMYNIIALFFCVVGIFYSKTVEQPDHRVMISG
mmetsp:Transcript_8370/g.10915  ORF Transcript_8370/g.10915 Transcript_8370/m.10915 type:complete len:528 (+) Transcript_8370:132-1715(+)